MLKNILKLVGGVLLPLVTIAFVVAEHAGWVDRYLGLNSVIDVARQFEISYASANRRVVPGDEAWEPVLDLIHRYSLAQLPPDRLPRVLGRSRAILSEKIDGANGEILAEWTAPSTPLVLFFRDWPTNTNTVIDRADYRFVGTIGDLRAWVDKRRGDFHFLVRDILLSVSSIVLTLLIWFTEFRSSPSPAKVKTPPTPPKPQKITAPAAVKGAKENESP